jgi:hypothetical protein
MEWKKVRGNIAFTVGEGGAFPERPSDYEAWVCDICGYEQQESA